MLLSGHHVLYQTAFQKILKRILQDKYPTIFRNQVSPFAANPWNLGDCQESRPMKQSGNQSVKLWTKPERATFNIQRGKMPFPPEARTSPMRTHKDPWWSEHQPIPQNTSVSSNIHKQSRHPSHSMTFTKLINSNISVSSQPWNTTAEGHLQTFYTDINTQKQHI